MSSQQTPIEDLVSRVDALSQQIQDLEHENEALRSRLADAEDEREELRRRLADVEDNTDLLRLIESADDASAQQMRTAILQHMWRAIRNEDPDDQVIAMTPEKVTEILHHPDVDRTTILRWMRTTPRLVGDDDVCWYDGGDRGPTGAPARLHLDVRGAGESVIQNVKRQSRRSNNVR